MFLVFIIQALYVASMLQVVILNVSLVLTLQLQPFKPIFHCDAKYLASGVGVGQCPRRQNFALGIPTCWYFGANTNPLICVLVDAKPQICILADAKPKRKPVEYRLCWVPTQNSGVGHVHFNVNANPVSSGI